MKLNGWSILSMYLNESTECDQDLIGKADKSHTKENEVDPDELKMGLKIEEEHTQNPSIAKQIAMDHLTEIPDYYSRLKKMEDKAKAQGDKNG